MFVSNDWSRSRFSIDYKEKKTTEIIINTKFWNGVSYTVKVTSAIMKMLKLVYGDQHLVTYYIMMLWIE